MTDATDFVSIQLISLTSREKKAGDSEKFNITVSIQLISLTSREKGNASASGGYSEEDTFVSIQLISLTSRE